MSIERIKEAAEEFSIGLTEKGVYVGLENAKIIFMAGAGSTVAKDHWREGMYSEHDVQLIAMRAISAYQDVVIKKLKGDEFEEFDFSKWWNEHKQPKERILLGSKTLSF